MPTGPFEILHGGARYALVARRDVYEHLDERAARRLVEEGLREHGHRFARQLEDLAQRLGGRDHDPVVAVIDALVAGRLVAVRWNPPVRLMSEPEYTELHDMGGGDVDGPIVGGDPREPVAALRTTWLSFDVVDDRGEPIGAGRFGAAIDGRGQGGPLDGERHRYDMLRESAEAALRLEDIVWPFEPGVPDKPTTPSVLDDPAGPVGPDSARVVSLEVVDDQGAALTGRYTLTASADEVHGELGGVLRREVTGDAPQLRLRDIVFPVAPTPSPPAA